MIFVRSVRPWCWTASAPGVLLVKCFPISGGRLHGRTLARVVVHRVDEQGPEQGIV